MTGTRIIALLPYTAILLIWELLTGHMAPWHQLKADQGPIPQHEDFSLTIQTWWKLDFIFSPSNHQNVFAYATTMALITCAKYCCNTHQCKPNEISINLKFSWKFIDDMVPRETIELRTHLDSFPVPLHSPNSRHLPAIRAVQRDCHGGVENSGNSHWSCEPMMQWGTRQSQAISRPTNHKSMIPANWRPCLIPQWQSYFINPG